MNITTQRRKIVWTAVLFWLLAAALTVSVLATDASAPTDCTGSEIWTDREIFDASDDAYTLRTADVYDWGDDTRYFDQLSETEKELYAYIENAFASGSVVGVTADDSDTVMYWEIGYIYTKTRSTYAAYTEEYQDWRTENLSEIDSAYRSFLYDHPQYFWVRNGFRVSYHISGSSGGTVCARAYMQTYVWYPYDTQAKVDAFQAKIDSVVDGLLTATEGMAVIARLAYFDNWLAANNDYNKAAAADSAYIQTDETPWSIVGAFLPEYAPVCEGYAKAFQLLCHEIGVPCIQILGSGHMWTAVRINDLWYVVDPTWDDPTYNGGNTRAYSTKQYFLVHQSEDHTPYMVFSTPEIAKTGYFANGFVRNSDTILGGEAVMGGTVLIALYDANGKMLDVGFCVTFSWGESRRMCLAPSFASETLQKTAKAVRFVLSDEWMPFGYVEKSF